MSIKVKSVLTLIIVILFWDCTDSTIVTIPNNVVEGVLTVCPGTVISLTCSYDAGGAESTRWEVVSGSTLCVGIVSHKPPSPAVCGALLSLNNASDFSEPVRMSTAQATATEALNGGIVICRNGTSSSDPQAGNITIKVIEPTAVVENIELFVDSSMVGGVRLTVGSPGASGTDVTYDGSVTVGLVMVTGSLLTVTGLDYNQNHAINVTAVTAQCTELVSTTVVDVTLNTGVLSVSEPVASVICSNPSLPIQLSWTVTQIVNSTTDPASLLTPPMTGPPEITFTTSSGERGNVSSSSPYLLPNSIVNDVYNFTVSISNVAGVTTRASSLVRARRFLVDSSTVETMSCLTVMVNEDCLEDITTGDFSILFQRRVGNCQTLSEFITSTIELRASSTCLSIDGDSSSGLCYQVTLMYRGTVIDSQTNNFTDCSVSELESFLGAGVTYHHLNGSEIMGETVSHFTTVAFDCESVIHDLSGMSQTTCFDGSWSSTEMRSCSVVVWLIVVIILVIVLVLIIGIVCGVLIGRYWHSLTEALSCKKLWAIVVVILLVLVIGIGVGILFYCCCRRCDSSSNSKRKDSEKHELAKSSSPPPPDTLYADPNTIEHQTTDTGEQYAMVDVKGKKKKPTQAVGLYQDPNAIEHQTAPSGEMYAVVDKPNRGSSRKKEPDVVPPGSGLTYADIDVSASRNKSKPRHQQAQHPGHVEYADVSREHTGL